MTGVESTALLQSSSSPSDNLTTTIPPSYPPSLHRSGLVLLSFHLYPQLYFSPIFYRIFPCLVYHLFYPSRRLFGRRCQLYLHFSHTPTVCHSRETANRGSNSWLTFLYYWLACRMLPCVLHGTEMHLRAQENLFSLSRWCLHWYRHQPSHLQSL